MKLSMNWKSLAMGGVLAALATLLLTATPLFAQTATPSANDGMTMTDMASPVAGASPSADQMMSMMEQCLTMMKMMSDMMGGGMAGAMATPGTGMPGMMATPTTVSGQ